MRNKKKKQSSPHISLFNDRTLCSFVLLFSSLLCVSLIRTQPAHGANAVGSTVLVGTSDFACAPTIAGAVSGNFVTANGNDYTNVTSIEVTVTSDKDATFTLSGDLVGTPSGTVTATGSTTVQATITSGDGTKTVSLIADDQGGPGRCWKSTELILDQTPPTTPTLLDPDNFTNLKGPTTIEFSWSGSTDAGVGMDDYKLNINKESNFSGEHVESTTTTNTLVTVDGSSSMLGNNYWRVEARDLLGNSAPSLAFSFSYQVPGVGGDSICGDGNVQGSEECDDGNNESFDGCSAICKIEDTYCGDGKVNQPTEECDDGNDNNNDYCNDTCELQQCYQWTEDIGEACSDYEGNIIYLLIDQSASMAGEKITKTKQAALNILNQLQPGSVDNDNVSGGTLVGLISFNDAGQTKVSPPTANFDFVRAQINAISTQGYSNIADPINKVTSALKDNYQNTEKHIILLTDGLPSIPAPGPGQQAQEAAQAAKDLGITLFTIGLQTASNADQLLKSIASSPSQFYKATSPEQLSTLYEQILSEMICGADAPQYVNICPDDCGSLVLDRSRPTEDTYQVETLRCAGAGDGVYHIEFFDSDGSLVEEFMAHTQNPEGWTFNPSVPFSLPYDDYTVTCTVGVASNSSCAQTLGGGSDTGVCGDGYLDPGELCDDGNNDNTDLCTNDCQPQSPGVCGNGVIEADEACDDGNLLNGDGCSASCEQEDIPQPVCGDGIVELREGCDDGNRQSGDGCSANCRVETLAYCGDGMLNTVQEECDDGNRQSGDGCSANCQAEGTIVLKIKKEGVVSGEDGNLGGFSTQGDESILSMIEKFLRGSTGDEDAFGGQATYGHTGNGDHPAPKGLGTIQEIQKKMATYGLFLFWALVYDIETYRVWYNIWMFSTPVDITDSYTVYQFNNTQAKT